MGNSNFTDEFKIDADKQITERGYSVADVSRRLGVSTHSLYSWKKRFDSSAKAMAQDDQLSNILQLKQELARFTEERDIYKKATAYFAKDVKLSTRLSKRIVCNLMCVPCAACFVSIPVDFIHG